MGTFLQRFFLICKIQMLVPLLSCSTSMCISNDQVNKQIANITCWYVYHNYLLWSITWTNKLTSTNVIDNHWRILEWLRQPRNDRSLRVSEFRKHIQHIKSVTHKTMILLHTTFTQGEAQCQIVLVETQNAHVPYNCIRCSTDLCLFSSILKQRITSRNNCILSKIRNNFIITNTISRYGDLQRLIPSPYTKCKLRECF